MKKNEEVIIEQISLLICETICKISNEIEKTYTKDEIKLDFSIKKDKRTIKIEAAFFILSITENHIFHFFEKTNIKENDARCFISLIRKQVSSRLINDSSTLNKKQLDEAYDLFCNAYIERFKIYQKLPLFVENNNQWVTSSSTGKLLSFLLPEDRSVAVLSDYLSISEILIAFFELINKLLITQDLKSLIEDSNNNVEVKEEVNENSVTELMQKMKELSGWIMIGGLISFGNFIISYGERFAEYQVKEQILLLSIVYILFMIPLVLILVNGLSIKKNEYKINVSTYSSVKKIMVIAGIMAATQFFFNLIQGGLMIIIFLDAWSIFKRINKLKKKFER